jgi:hypothetical protein
MIDTACTVAGKITGRWLQVVLAIVLAIAAMKVFA